MSVVTASAKPKMGGCRKGMRNSHECENSGQRISVHLSDSLIDFSRYLHDGEEEQKQFIEEIMQDFTTSGFL